LMTTRDHEGISSGAPDEDGLEGLEDLPLLNRASGTGDGGTVRPSCGEGERRGLDEHGFCEQDEGDGHPYREVRGRTGAVATPTAKFYL